MSISDDIKGLRSSLKKPSHKAKKVSSGTGWYAEQLTRESKAGIDQKKKIKPTKNVAHSNLFMKVLESKKK